MGPDGRALFAESVAALARSLDHVDIVLVDLTGFTLDGVLVSGEAFRLSLHNLWTATRPLEGEDRAAEVDRQTRAMFAPCSRPAAWSEAQDQLVPALRPASAFEGMDVIRREAFPHLVEALALDLPDSVTYVASAQLRQWDREANEAFDQAHGTIRGRASDGLDVFHSRIDRPLWSVEPADSFAPSRLLLPGWLAGLAGAIGGRPVAAIPHRTSLLIARAEDEVSLATLARQAAAEYGAAPGPVSPALYTVDDRGAVVPLAVSDGHPGAGAVAAGHALLRAHEEGSGT